jgi:hypothetical protein
MSSDKHTPIMYVLKSIRAPSVRECAASAPCHRETFYYTSALTRSVAATAHIP